jgi:hypothetical protein
MQKAHLEDAIKGQSHLFRFVWRERVLMRDGGGSEQGLEAEMQRMRQDNARLQQEHMQDQQQLQQSQQYRQQSMARYQPQDEQQRQFQGGYPSNYPPQQNYGQAPPPQQQWPGASSPQWGGPGESHVQVRRARTDVDSQIYPEETLSTSHSSTADERLSLRASTRGGYKLPSSVARGRRRKEEVGRRRVEAREGKDVALVSEPQ